MPRRTRSASTGAGRRRRSWSSCSPGAASSLPANCLDPARMSACASNMKQIGTALMMYTQDYDETFPCIRFHEWSAEKGKFCYVWKNALRPYLKSLDVFGCPTNPLSRSIAGVPGSYPLKPGMNAEGWEMEPSQRMPISYGMNSCAASLYPADNPQ